MRRLAALLLALAACLCIVSAPQQAAADDGIIGGGVELTCEYGGGLLGAAIVAGADAVTGRDLCDEIGKTVQKKVNKAWDAVWDSVLGDVINSAADVTRWVIKKVITVALLGPSLDLEATGLFGRHATLAGMLTWLGLVIATFGAMWQIGKMAITGQSKHIGRAMLGWVESTFLSAVGVGLIALLVAAGDAMTSGLVNATFDSDSKAYDRIISTLLPKAISNPVTMLSVVSVLALIGFAQLIMVFLRQSAIPIQCLLLPVAGGGRVGGDVTRQWAPRLITSICVVIAYKPILAIIICTGFSEFGHSQTLAEWLRGCATLLLAVIAPGPLTKLFAPFGEVVGGGMAAGGIGGALTSAASFIGGRQQGRDSDDGTPAQPTTPMAHAQYVEQSMGSQSGHGGQSDDAGGDARAQAARNDTNAARVPAQGGPEGAPAGAGATVGAGPSTGQAAGAGGAAGGGAAAGAGTAGVVIQVLDGVNNTVQDASKQIGNGGNTQ